MIIEGAGHIAMLEEHPEKPKQPFAAQRPEAAKHRSTFNRFRKRYGSSYGLR
jgi:hypothetical protein